jgi:hypothetical protein
MSSTFSNRQQELLSAAAGREDRLLPIPPHLKGGAAQKVAAKLVAAGLAKEVKAKAGVPIWRRDTETEQGDALKLTALGARAVAAAVKNVSDDTSLVDRACASNIARSFQRSAASRERVRGASSE